MTKIEEGYIAQGYELPDGFTWERVGNARELFGISQICVPVACGPGVIAWGVPMRDGKFLTRE